MKPPNPKHPTEVSPSVEPTVDELLAHEGWLRRVVVELVDEHEAEDLLQETWAVALRKGPGRLLAPRPWLRAVARNLAQHHRRSAARRRQREQAAARDERLPSTEAMVERLQAHRQVAQAVADLAEPYRTAVLLRFFEDLPPRTIARRLNLPGSTVRTRIERGLQKLRGRLEGADRRALAALILAPRSGEAAVPLGTLGAGVTLGIGVLTMAARHQTATAASLVILLGASIWLASGLAPQPGHAGQDRPRKEVAGATAGAPDRATPDRPPIADGGRRALPEPATAETPAPTAPPIRGRVLDHRGQPLGGVPILFAATKSAAKVYGFLGLERDPNAAPPEQVAVSDGQGEFTFTSAHESGRLTAGGELVTVRTFTPAPAHRADERALIIATPRNRVRGRVVSWLGLPISGVSVTARLEGLVDIDVPIDQADQLALPFTTTDKWGAFAFDALPSLPELELEFNKAGYLTERRHGLEPEADLRVVLKGAGESSWRISGTVVDQSGHLVPDATVFLHQTLAKSGPYGEFTISTRFLTEESKFLAGIPGFQPASRPDLVKELCQTGAEMRRTGVVLKIGGPALSIRGQVVDHQGAPVQGRIVTLFDARQAGGVNTVEDFIAGKESRLEKAGKGSAKVDARTDGEGRFAVGGLEPREYRLRIFDADSLRSTTVTVAAGRQDLLVRLPEPVRRRIRGTVVSARGLPRPRVLVSWGLETLRCGGMRILSSGGSCETGEDGRFEFADLPGGDIELSLHGNGIVGRSHPLQGVADGADLRIETLARCRFRVEVEDGTVTAVKVLDAAGRTLELERHSGQISYSGESWTVKRGRTPVLEVSEAGHTIVFLRDEEEVGRKRLDLDPDQVVVVGS